MPLDLVDRGQPCLLIHDRAEKTAASLTKKLPLPLLCVGNRYLVEHQLEWLSDNGFKKILLSLGDRPRETEKLVGSGARWGTEVQVSLDPEFFDLESSMRKSLAGVDGGVLLVDGATFMRFDMPKTLDYSTAFFLPAEDGSETGTQIPCLYLTPQGVDALLGQSEAAYFRDLCTDALEFIPDIERVTVNAFFQRIASTEDFLAMNTMIQTRPDLFQFKGAELEEGVRVGRRCHISPKATLTAPTLVGDGAFIKSGAEIGPGAFIGDQAYIEAGASIVNTVVAPGTYIGPNTSFENKYVCRTFVLDLQDKTSIVIDDPAILTDITKPTPWGLGAERVIAFFLAILAFFPTMVLALLHKIVRGSFLVREEILYHPVKQNLRGEYDFQWRSWRRFGFGFFLLDILPSLFDIANGHLAFVGNPPLRREDLKNLDEEWRDDLLAGKVGCTGLVQQLGREHLGRDETLATAIFYNATRNFKQDWSLFFKAWIPGKHRFL